MLSAWREALSPSLQGMASESTEMRSKQGFSRAFLRASPGRKIVGKLAFLAPFGQGNSESMCG